MSIIYVLSLSIYVHTLFHVNHKHVCSISKIQQSRAKHDQFVLCILFAALGDFRLRILFFFPFPNFTTSHVHFQWYKTKQKYQIPSVFLKGFHFYLVGFQLTNLGIMVSPMTVKHVFSFEFCECNSDEALIHVCRLSKLLH